MFGKKKPDVVQIQMKVDTTELDAAMAKVREFNKMLEEVDAKLQSIDKRVEAIPHDTLEDSGYG